MTKITKTSLLKYLLPIVLFACVFCVRLSMLQKSSEPNGLDGYFYALQARSFVETGHLENPSHEPGYYLCGICSLFTKNPILGVKVWSALSSALSSLAVFLIIFALSGQILLSLLGFLLSAASPSFSSMSLNFINNQTGICFLLFYAFFLVRALKSWHKKSSPKTLIFRIFPCVTFFVLSVISHKVTMISAFALTFVIFLLYTMRFARGIWGRLGKPLRIFFVALILLAAAVVFVAGILFFSRHAPRFMNAFSLPSFTNHNSIDRSVTKFGSAEIAFYALALYCVSVLAVFKKSPYRNLLLLVPFLYFPFWNLESDMAVRILMSAVPLGIPLFLYEVHLLFPENFLPKIRKIACSLLSLSLLAGLFFTPRVYNPKKDPPYSYYKKVVSKIQLPSDTLLIAHLGLNHVYTYYNGLKDALNWLPDFEIAPEKTWRLSYGVNSSYLESFFEEHALSDEIQNEIPENYADLIEPIDSKYTLLREDLWQFYLSHEEPEIAETYKNWYNPHEVRPSYIRKVKK